MNKYKFKTKPFKHQLTALNNCWDKDVYGLLMEMGTGKTKVLIDNLGILYNQGVINSALIVAPKGVYKTWEQQELPKHLPNYIMEHTRVVMWQPNLTQKQMLKMQTIMESTDDLKIFIMNTEAFSTEKGIKYAEKFLLSNKTMFVIDESTTIKNPQAKRTRNIIKLSNLTKYKRILTGTPVTRSPLDLYSQFYFLDPDILNFSSYYSFRSRYAMMVNRTMGSHSFNLIVGYRNLKELSKKLKPHSYRILKEKCLDLPDITYVEREAPLTLQQEHYYML